MAADPRICVIGAGPSGMSVLYQFAEVAGQGLMPNIVCYEKQKSWGGIWNYTWRTGLDENNEHCHSSVYRTLWTNAPKEANLEYPDYTYERHFGKPVPSYLPAPALRHYLEGRWTTGAKKDLKQFVQFNTIVRFVRYDDNQRHYIVTLDNRDKNETTEEIFSHVIVCSGIFNFPNQPELPGLDKFQGRVLHSHYFRGGSEFKGQNILVVGSSYSAEDISLHCLKFGANHITMTYRNKSLNLKWPPQITEHAYVQGFDANHAYFKDGSKIPIDAVIFCTGYRNHFPFLETKLRIPEDTAAYPRGLYKGTLLVGHGDNKLFYVGVQDQIYSMTYFDSIALWISKYILNKISGEPKTEEEMVANMRDWETRGLKVTGTLELLALHTDLLEVISEDNGYTKKTKESVPIFEEWLKHRHEDMATFRDHQFRSVFTGKVAPPQEKFMKAFDDSLETFLRY